VHSAVAVHKEAKEIADREAKVRRNVEMMEGQAS
jgi:hypothetical protein